jgi:hypothetical protein
MFGTEVSPQGLSPVEQAAGMLNKIREIKVFLSNSTVILSAMLTLNQIPINKAFLKNVPVQMLMVNKTN